MLTYGVDNGSYVAMEEGYPYTQVDVTFDVVVATVDDVPGPYASPDRRYTAAIHRDESGPFTSHTQLVRIIGIACQIGRLGLRHNPNTGRLIAPLHITSSSP